MTPYNQRYHPIGGIFTLLWRNDAGLALFSLDYHVTVQLTVDRPVVWTSLAILFAHESEPAIVGRAFPSSRQFRLQSPPIIANAPGSYDPPTILCISPDGNWLFAYFPGRQIPGVGCFWRAQHADGWDMIESISFTRSRGVVSAKWLGHVREVRQDTLMPSKYSFTYEIVGRRLRPKSIQASSTWTCGGGLLAYTCAYYTEPSGATLLHPIWPSAA